MFWCCTYNPHKSNISNHLISLRETLNIQMSKYYNFLIAGDFNSELSESTLNTFCESHYLHNKVSIVLEIQTIAMYRFKPFVPNAPFLYSRFSQFSGARERVHRKKWANSDKLFQIKYEYTNSRDWIIGFS